MPSLTISLSLRSRLRSSTRVDSYGLLGFNPALVFDFKNDYFRKAGADTTFSSAMTHTRASSANMVNSSGTLVTAANNVPRTGHHIYNGSAWVNEGILHESEARTNQMVNSGDLTGAGWAGGVARGSVTAGSPFGTYQFISPSSSSATISPAQRYQIGKAITSGATYVGWSLVKYSAGSGWFVVNMFDTGKSNEQAYFDLQNGVVGSKNALIIDHGMVDYGDGWWLCWASANAASTSGGVSYEMPNGDNVQSCSSADVVLIAGTQLEAASTPSSYIPTTSATVTRAAETLTVPAANLPYSSTNMSIQMDGKMTGDNLVFTRWFKDADNSILQKSGAANFVFAQEASNVIDASTGGSFTSGVNVEFNLASRHGATFVQGAEGGSSLTADTTPTALPDLSVSDLTLGRTFMGTIGQFRMWDEDLTDAGIVTATLPSTEPSLSLAFDGSETSFTVLDWSE